VSAGDKLVLRRSESDRQLLVGSYLEVRLVATQKTVPTVRADIKKEL